MLVPVLLCGGVGSRLWPVSRKLYPKQFNNLVQEQESLLQETLRRVCHFPDSSAAMVVCNDDHRFLVAEQSRAIATPLSKIILEPVGKNTAPAVALAALEAKTLAEDPVLLILPADHVIEDDVVFAEAVDRGRRLAEQGKLVTFGIVPTRAHTGYGYIQRGAELPEGFAYTVDAFVEKPDLATAQQYIDQETYFWNSGMFMFRVSDYLRELSLHAEDIYAATQKAFVASTHDVDFRRIPAEEFSACRAESIDYAVMEKTANAVVLPLAARWNDVGEWDALWELGQRDAQGNVTSGDTCLHDVKNSLIRAESRLVAGLGLENLVVVETIDAVLVADKARIQDVKQIFSTLESQGREEVVSHAKVFRPWGSYEGLAMSEGYQVKRIIVNPGGILSLQKHYKRAEHWVVVSGVAKVWIGEEELTLQAGQSTYIPLEVKHRLANEGEDPLVLIEVQCGAYLGEDDIVRYEDVYGRVGTKA